MLLAWFLPLFPTVTSKVTFWPSCSDLKPLALIAEKCANKSSPPASGVMKPNPFASLNHLTVPVAICMSSNKKGLAREPSRISSPKNERHSELPSEQKPKQGAEPYSQRHLPSTHFSLRVNPPRLYPALIPALLAGLQQLRALSANRLAAVDGRAAQDHR